MLEWIIILGLVIALYIIIYKYEKRMDKLHDMIHENKNHIQKNRSRLDEHYNHLEKLWVNVPFEHEKKDKKDTD